MSNRTRLLLGLFAPLLLAATPAEPLNARLGVELILRLPLPEGSSVVGYPELAPFALRTPPEINDGELVLELVPLRPGRHLFPALPLLDSSNRSLQTAPLVIDVTAPEPPAALQPLKQLPSMANPQSPQSPRRLWLLALLLTATTALIWLLRRRRQPEATPLSRLDLLARNFAVRDDRDDPRWQAFRSQLQRLRFAPLDHDDAQIDTLCAQFEALCREAQP